MLYYSQGALYDEGSLLSRVLLVFILLISLYFFAYANQHYKLPKPLKILTFLVIVFSIYGIIPLIVGVGDVRVAIQPFQFIKFIYLSLLPIYTFYVFWQKKWITETTIRLWFFVFWAVAIAGFYYSNKNMLAAAISAGSSAEEFTNNEGYTVLSLICLLPLFNKRPILQYVLLSVCMAYVLMGFKRGAMLAAVPCLFWFVMQTFKTDNHNKSKIFRQLVRLLLVVALVFGVVYGVQYLLHESDYFNYRMDQTASGESSGRDVYYTFFLNHILNDSNIVEILFGNGAYGTAIVFGDGAHNDWFEIMIDNGIIILVVYLSFWISLFVMLFKGNRSSMATTMLGLFVLLYFMKTFYSMSYNTVTPYAACALAYALANYERKVKIHKT